MKDKVPQVVDKIVQVPEGHESPAEVSIKEPHGDVGCVESCTVL